MLLNRQKTDTLVLVSFSLVYGPFFRNGEHIVARSGVKPSGGSMAMAIGHFEL